jgi:DNA-directed RNA polymerase specialized sigma subunit
MKADSKEKIVMPKLYGQENKVKIMKEMLEHLLKESNPFLYEREINTLRWILIDGMGIKEVADKLQLTTTRANQLFNNAVKRINHRFSGLYPMI